MPLPSRSPVTMFLAVARWSCDHVWPSLTHHTEGGAKIGNEVVASGRRELEHDAIAVSVIASRTTAASRPVEASVSRLNESRVGTLAVRPAGKRVEDGDRAGGSHLEDRASVEGAADARTSGA